MYRLRVKGYMSVTPPTEENIMSALYLEGPLAVAVNPMPQSLQDYRKGERGPLILPVLHFSASLK